MDDVISRQDAITLPVMPKEHREYQTYNLDDAYEQGWFDLQKCIEKLPSAQPEVLAHGEGELSAQPEIVRCKECKWKQGSECVRFADVRPFPDDFCSRAERRTNDEG